MEKTFPEHQSANIFNQIIQKLLMDIHIASQANGSNSDADDIQIAESILRQYTFENRLEMKGLITHTIIDSLNLESSISEKIIQV